jgi:FAD/FMN-containing dehydrogenase
MNSLTVATLEVEPVRLSAETVRELSDRVLGPVVTPDQSGYREARRVWNGMIDERPGLVVRCRGAADVIRAVRFAREHELLVAVRGGGHNVAGTGTCDGGLVIDLSPMRSVRVDPQDRTVRAQGGATWRDVDHETQAFGLATPGGVVSETGIAGFTLGGGLGWLRRKYGLTCDNLIAADVVTADGELVRTSETERPDLFWALRGGGGNFGIVTSLEYRLHEVGPEVMFAAVMYPFEQAGELLPAWRDFVEEAPEEVSAEALFWTVPDVDTFPEEARGRKVFIVAALHCGDWREGERVLKPLRELDEPVLDLSAVAPYEEVQTMFDPFFPAGEKRYYWKSLRLERLDDDVIAAIVDHAASRPSPDTIVPIWHHGGAMSRVGPAETAFGDRSAPYLLSLDSTWTDSDDDQANVEWTREVWRDMQRFSTRGSYLNFPGMGEEGERLVRDAYGANYERLTRVKAEYDPDNFFRVNQNIEPAIPD